MRARLLLAAAPLLLLTGCIHFAANQSTQDADLILTTITPVARSVGTSQVEAQLAATTKDTAILDSEGIPGLLEIQAFFDDAQSLLVTLAAIPTLTPDQLGVVQAATALLPPFATAANTKLTVRPAMSPEQARLILRSAPAAAPPPPQPPPQSAPPRAPAAAAPAALPTPGAARFHLSVDDVDGHLTYEFLDRGQVMERGVAASFRVLETRYEAFKKQRLSQAP